MLRRKGGYKHNGLSPMDVVLGIVLSILGLLVVLPFYNAIMISFVTEAEYFKTPFVFYPHAPTLEAYRTLLETGNILVGYGNTLFHIAVALPVSMFMTFSLGYVLSRPASRDASCCTSLC